MPQPFEVSALPKGQPFPVLCRPEAEDVRTAQGVETPNAAAGKAMQREILAPEWSSCRSEWDGTFESATRAALEIAHLE